MIRSIAFFAAFTFGLMAMAQQQVRVELEQPFIYEGDTLRGTLLSKGKSLKKFNKIPLVIFISGSGPTDRDGNSTMIPGENNSFLQLADSLLKYGVASYRYDKLGIGASQTKKSEGDLRFEDNAEVAQAALAKMKELGFKDIFIAGHSEGSLVGMLTAQQSKMDGYISIAGPSENALEVLKVQLRDNMPDSIAEPAIVKLDSVKSGYEVEKFPPSLFALLRPSVQPYLTSYFKYTPTEEIKKVEVPVLIIQGGRDLQVSQSNGEALRTAKPEAEYRFYPNMNHVLKKVDNSREQNIGAYGDPDFPLANDLAKDIAEWIKNQ